MYISKMTWRSRNDFGFVAKCRWCQHTFERNDGYADIYFQRVVVPSQQCPECDMNEFGMTHAEFQRALTEGYIVVGYR